MGMGALSCGGHIAKWTLFAFNCIFWLCSVAILGVGIWLAVDPNAWDYLIVIEEGGMDDPLLAAAVYTMIGVGCFMFLVGFAGCWGACTESKTWLTLYCILVTVCLLIEITAGILAIVYKDQIDEAVEVNMYEQVVHRYGNEDDSPTLTEAWDAMQDDLKCCGSYNYTDYRNSFYYNDTSNIVPVSCCITDSDPSGDYDLCKTEAQDHVADAEQLYRQGCYHELKSSIDDASLIIACVMFGLAFVQLIVLLIACCLKDDIANSDTFA